MTQSLHKAEAGDKKNDWLVDLSYKFRICFHFLDVQVVNDDYEQINDV